jgi:hypothetical protein
MLRSFVSALLVFAATAAVACPNSSARAAATCGEGMYAYAGFKSRAAASGVTATIRQAGPLAVNRGHVAGWIGVVRPTDGRAWLQVGLSALPGETQSAIYYEAAAPGHGPVYHELRAGIAAGKPHRFAIVEQRPNWWVVRVDGSPAGPPIYLRGSHGSWSVQALGESWGGDASGACNGYAYAFTDLHLSPVSGRTAGGLRGTFLHDPHYEVRRLSPTGFVAASLGLAGLYAG